MVQNKSHMALPHEVAASITHREADAAVERRLFTDARTHSHWLPKPVAPDLLRELVRLVQCGPTTMNTQPLRIQFVVSAAAKARLVACVNPGNVSKTQSAPVVAILGQDLAFPERLPVLYAHYKEARAYYDGKPEFTASTALRNSSLQGGYLILAARLLGLDCGPMSGFDSAAVDKAFWGGTAVRTNFLCNLGYGDATQLKPRPPRLGFEDVCRIV
jgi:3-hydroxypropanoate dehydrogenase